MIAPAAEQLSLALACTLGTAAWQLASALALEAGGQLTVGGVLSVTVKVVVQLALLPAASVAVTVIVCAPRPTWVPAAGDWVRVIAPSALQLSLTLADTLGTAAWQFASALALEAGGQLTVGGVLSVTVKVVVHSTLLLLSSVAVTVMVCVPNPSSVPAAGD